LDSAIHRLSSEAASVGHGPSEIAFLTWLATDRRVSASTQNQALSALLFLHRDELRIEIGFI
jgi:hypothetical protein